MIKCLIQFHQDYDWLDFRCAELDSLIELFGVDPNICYCHPTVLHSLDAFLLVDFPNEEIISKICERSITIKCVYELWSSSESFNGLIEKTRELPLEFSRKYIRHDLSWSIRVGAYMRTLTMDHQQKLREKFEFLKFPGPVKLKNPDVDLMVLLDYSIQYKSNTKLSYQENQSIILNSTQTANQEEMGDSYAIPCYLGRIIATGGMKEELKKYDLKRRLYLGPTSLDSSLAMLMANIAGTVSGTYMLDPFVGTASILVALTHFGAACVGYDIDIRVLRGQMHAGKQDPAAPTSTHTNNCPNDNDTSPSVTIAEAGEGDMELEETLVTGEGGSEIAEAAVNLNSDTPEVDPAATAVAPAAAVAVSPGGDAGNRKTKKQKSVSGGEKGFKLKNIDNRTIWDNFKSYGLQPPELIRMDNHLFERHLAPIASDFFDAIVTDPPYGIRAGARKSGKRGGGECQYEIPEDKRADHVPSTQAYPVEQVVLDLLHNAALSLKLGGKLLYLLPTSYDFTREDLPRHPCFELTHLCQQPLSSRHCRYLVVLKKTRIYDEKAVISFATYKESVFSGQDKYFGILLSKLQLALSQTAFSDASIVKNMSNTCKKRRERKAKRITLIQEGKMGEKMKLLSKSSSPTSKERNSQEFEADDCAGDVS